MQIDYNQATKIFNDAKDALVSMKDKIFSMEKEQSKKMSFIRNKLENINYLILNRDIEQQNRKEESYIFSLVNPNNLANDDFDIYGETIHPKMLTTPRNIFNFTTATEAIFKNNMIVKVNDIEDNEFKNMLMHDSIPEKEITFREFDTDTVKIEIIVDQGNLLGDTKFNMIEIFPLITGFDITSFHIYTMQSQYSTPELADYITQDIKDVGLQRFVFEEMNLYKFEFTVKLKFKNGNGRYPFGIQHLYFYNAKLSEESFIALEVKSNNKKFFDYIYDNIIIGTDIDKINTTCSQNSIEAYKEFANGEFKYPIAVSTDNNPEFIVSNINQFYVKIPLSRSLKNIEFEKIILK